MKYFDSAYGLFCKLEREKAWSRLRDVTHHHRCRSAPHDSTTRRFVAVFIDVVVLDWHLIDAYVKFGIHTVALQIKTLLNKNLILILEKEFLI